MVEDKVALGLGEFDLILQDQVQTGYGEAATRSQYARYEGRIKCVNPMGEFTLLFLDMGTNIPSYYPTFLDRFQDTGGLYNYILHIPDSPIGSR